MAGTLSKGIKLSYKASGGNSYTDLTNLQEIPDLGGSADSVEVTTLDDAAHMYINGLKDYGDSLDFTFLYDKTQFTTLNGLSGYSPRFAPFGTKPFTSSSELSSA